MTRELKYTLEEQIIDPNDKTIYVMPRVSKEKESFCCQAIISSSEPFYHLTKIGDKVVISSGEYSALPPTILGSGDISPVITSFNRNLNVEYITPQSYPAIPQRIDNKTTKMIYDFLMENSKNSIEQFAYGIMPAIIEVNNLKTVGISIENFLKINNIPEIIDRYKLSTQKTLELRALSP